MLTLLPYRTIGPDNIKTYIDSQSTQLYQIKQTWDGNKFEPVLFAIDYKGQELFRLIEEYKIKGTK